VKMGMRQFLKNIFSTKLIYLTTILSALVQLGLFLLYPLYSLGESDLNAEYNAIQLIDLQEELMQPQTSLPNEIKEVEISDEIKEKPSPVQKIDTLQKVSSASGGRGIFYSALVIDELPQIIKEAPKIYPALAKEKGKEGRVVLDIYIDTQGRLVDIVVIQNPGYGFAEAALEYVRNSSWQPAKHQGRAVPVRIRKPIIYSLDE
jgi:TonB family protein